jgi:hypothetical protein
VFARRVLQGSVPARCNSIPPAFAPNSHPHLSKPLPQFFASRLSRSSRGEAPCEDSSGCSSSVQFPRKIVPLFSIICELPNLQLLCFDIHALLPGGVGVRNCVRSEVLLELCGQVAGSKVLAPLVQSKWETNSRARRSFSVRGPARRSFSEGGSLTTLRLRAQNHTATNSVTT